MIRLAAMKNTSKLSETDLCVMCGMCLPLCPTYQLYQSETESPRGRIALMQAIDKGNIDANKKSLSHIDHCLGCLNCETICPSRVPYGKLIDEFRDQFSEQIKKPFSSKLVLKQLAHSSSLDSLASLARKPVLKQLIKFSNIFPHMSDQLSVTGNQHFKSFYARPPSDSTNSRGEVRLFTGCTGKSIDSRTIKDAIKLLNRLGFDVSIPEQQTCCGALHQHNGQIKTAKRLLNNALEQFRQQDTLCNLFFSPACGAYLQQHSDCPVEDIRAFLLRELVSVPLKFTATSQTIALHESCSHRNMLKLKTLNIDLLKQVPEIQIIESTSPALCCGAGGIQSINHPEQAQALSQAKLKSFDLSQVHIFISDNIGCSLHMKSAISAYNPQIEIMHPVSFLASQLQP